MVHPQRPMLVREGPSMARRLARVATIVVVTVTVFVLGLAVTVLVVTD